MWEGTAVPTTCRIMPTRTCPPEHTCPVDACARFESDDPTPWLRIEPLGPSLAAKLAPDGPYAEVGEALRQYDAALQRLLDAGVARGAMAELLDSRAQLIRWLATAENTAEFGETRRWRITTVDPNVLPPDELEDHLRERVGAVVTGYPSGPRPPGLYRSPARHWCGKASRHDPHIGCNGFGMAAGPVAGCGRADQHPAHRSCDGKPA